MSFLFLFNSKLVRRTLIQSILLAVLFVLAPLALAASPDLSVNVGSSAGDLKQVSARVTVNAPPQFVWQTLTAYNEIASFVPGYKKCRVLSRKGDVSTLDVDMRVSRWLPSYKYQLRAQEDKRALRLYLHRISGDFKQLDGVYQLRSIENGSKTLVTYKLKVDSGVNLPGSTGVLKSNIEKALVAVRSRSEKQHQKSLIGRK